MLIQEHKLTNTAIERSRGDYKYLGISATEAGGTTGGQLIYGTAILWNLYRLGSPSEEGVPIPGHMCCASLDTVSGEITYVSTYIPPTNGTTLHWLAEIREALNKLPQAGRCRIAGDCNFNAWCKQSKTFREDLEAILADTGAEICLDDKTATFVSGKSATVTHGVYIRDGVLGGLNWKDIKIRRLLNATPKAQHAIMHYKINTFTYPDAHLFLDTKGDPPSGIHSNTGEGRL